jgi:hypothetical protein
MRPIQAVDEETHRVDPDDWFWNESWYFSWIDLAGGPAGFFRLGILPNQGRAMLWSFVHDGSRWVGCDESRLSFDDLDLTNGIAYDRFGLRFAWTPTPPIEGAQFTFEGAMLERTRTDSGAFVPVAVDLTCRATGAPHPTSSGHDDRVSEYEAHRFEQPLVATGTVAVGSVRHHIRAGGHRDKSWGPRDWRMAFALGDLQAGDHQLYFAGAASPFVGGGFVRHGASMEQVRTLEGTTIVYDDEAHTIREGRVVVDGLDVTLRPITPSVTFDMAHTCPEAETEHWLYWRTLVEANVPAWGGTFRGWLEASRYGVSRPIDRAEDE